jgi:hypothetical protein
MRAVAGDLLFGEAGLWPDGSAGARAQSHRRESWVLEMTPSEVKQIAEATGREIVRETLLAIGIDVTDPLAAQRDFAVMREIGQLAMDPEFRKDIEHTRKWRKAIEQIETKGVIAAIGMIVTGGLGLLWAGIRAKVGQ